MQPLLRTTTTSGTLIPHWQTLTRHGGVQAEQFEAPTTLMGIKSPIFLLPAPTDTLWKLHNCNTNSSIGIANTQASCRTGGISHSKEHQHTRKPLKTGDAWQDGLGTSSGWGRTEMRRRDWKQVTVVVQVVARLEFSFTIWGEWMSYPVAFTTEQVCTCVTLCAISHYRCGGFNVRLSYENLSSIGLLRQRIYFFHNYFSVIKDEMRMQCSHNVESGKMWIIL